MDNFTRHVRKAEEKDRFKALKRLTVDDGSGLRFRSDPPLLHPVDELFGAEQHGQVLEIVHRALVGYRRLTAGRPPSALRAIPVRRSGPEGRRCRQRRHPLLGGVVRGPGSRTTRCSSRSRRRRPRSSSPSRAEPLQFHGRRVVEGQRLAQSASDIFLGWDRTGGADGRDHDYYFRQLWDWKVSADVDSMAPKMMQIYGRLCGHTLAQAHARTGDRIAISAYLGSGRSIDRAMRRFAAAYADQNEADHAAFVARVRPSKDITRAG